MEITALFHYRILYTPITYHEIAQLPPDDLALYV